MDPDEARGGGGVDAGAVKVAAGGGDDAAHQKADDDRRRLHDGRAEALAEDDGQEDEEAEADVLGRAPDERVRRRDVGALGEEGGLAAEAEAGAAGPVLEAGLDEADAWELLASLFGRDRGDTARGGVRPGSGGCRGLDPEGPKQGSMGLCHVPMSMTVGPETIGGCSELATLQLTAGFVVGRVRGLAPGRARESSKLAGRSSGRPSGTKGELTKMLRIIRGGKNEIKISSSAHTAAVPMMAP